MSRRRGVADASGLFEAAPPAASARALGAEGHRDRVRQRLLEAGPQALLDHELLEAVLFLAILRKDTKPIARALLARFGGFAEVLSAPAAELLRVEGVGPSAVAALRTVQAAALRLGEAQMRDAPVLHNWERLQSYLTAALARERTEQFRVLFLDSRNRLLADEVMGAGTVNHAPVYPREVMRRAIELHATALVLVHNHPSGDPTPSRADVEMTREVAEAARLLGLTLHDHLVVGRGGTASLRQLGLM
ncbi:DNA repair protein RadC [Roseococcus sp. DSY-14]|uniref:RadC family protein n=1 Tax=Roseococcus sp. DSY-14 TaxID=3369650 RepID=UPI00387B366F